MITARQIRAAQWERGFEHKDFKVFTTKDAPGFVLIHQNGLIQYRVLDGVRTLTTDSLSRAVNYYNETEKRKAGRAAPPGSVEALRADR